MRFSHAFDIGRALEHGYDALKRFTAPMMVGGALMSVLDGGCNGNTGGDSGSSGGESIPLEELERWLPSDNSTELLQHANIGNELFPFSALPLDDLTTPMGIGIALGVVAAILVIATVFLFIRAWIQVGWIRLHQDILVDDKGDMGRLFGGADRAGTLFKFLLAKAFIGLGTTAAAAAPGILLVVGGVAAGSMATWIVGAVIALIAALAANLYVQLGLALGSHAVVLDDETALGAVERSWDLARGHRMTIFVFQLGIGIVQLIAALVGLMMLCIGALVTVPAARAIGDFGFTESYLLFTRPESERATWRGTPAARA